MGSILLRFTTALAAANLAFGCAVLEDIPPRDGDSGVPDERVSGAQVALDRLREVDAFIKLDNRSLGDQIRAELEAWASATGDLELHRLKVSFKPQHIGLDAVLAIAGESGQDTEAGLSGDVLLAFSGDRLIWLPRFDALDARGQGFGPGAESRATMPEAGRTDLLDRVNRGISDAVIVPGKNVTRIDPMPLGSIEVGARLVGFIATSARRSQALGGAFTVAGSAILIEPSHTYIALDLEFIPGFSRCPAAVHVSRSTFASDIRTREPFGALRRVGETGQTRHFFTEISGAKQPTTVIHYWFADGQPVAVEELPVGPSFRWRTWSSRRIDRIAGNWEVVVVEKSTGCVLHSLALSADPRPGSSAAAERPAEQVTFAQFRREFESRVAGFSILRETPGPVLLEVPSNFLSRVLQASLEDLRIDVDFDISDHPGRRVSAVLLPFEVPGINCDERNCAPQRECATGFTRCVQRRDNRDCSTCLFRNPLNGRCVNEGVDPICAAAKADQNRHFEAQMQSCRNREEEARMACERRRLQEIRSCEIEAQSEKSACEASREFIGRLHGLKTLADATGQVGIRGGLRAIFSDFDVEGGMTGLRMNLGFSAALDLEGTARFSPGAGLGPVASCISAWGGAYRASIIMPLAAQSIIGSMSVDGAWLSTAWSGYVLPAMVTPSPLEAIFVENPALLAECRIGLTVDRVADAMSGEDGAYFAGKIAFEIQPLPSRIELAPSSVDFGSANFTLVPILTATHLKYGPESP